MCSLHLAIALNAGICIFIFRLLSFSLVTKPIHIFVHVIFVAVHNAQIIHLAPAAVLAPHHRRNVCGGFFQHNIKR